MKIEQVGNPRDYVAAMLRRDLSLEPTPEEIDCLTASLLAAGAFAPERKGTEPTRLTPTAALDERRILEAKRFLRVAEPSTTYGDLNPSRRG